MTHNTSPLVSVIIPAYNCAAYIGACINSATSQSYRNMEIIVVNDGSSDNTEAIVMQHAAEDSRVILVNKVKNEGLVRARKTGVNAAKGKYIQCLDSDDTLRDGMIEVLVDKAEQSNADIVAEPFVMMDNGEVVDMHTMLDFEEMSGLEFLNAILNHEAFWCVWSKFHLRSLYQNPIDSPDISLGEDIILSTQLLMYSKKVVRIEDPVVTYNFSAASSMSHPTNFNKKSYSDMLGYIAWLDDFIDKHNLNEICDKGMATFHIEHSLRILRMNPLHGHKDMGRIVAALDRYPELSKIAPFKYNKIVSRYRKSHLYGLLTVLYYRFRGKF